MKSLEDPSWRFPRLGWYREQKGRSLSATDLQSEASKDSTQEYYSVEDKVESKQVYQELRFHGHRCGGVERTAQSPGRSRDNHVSIFGTIVDRRDDRQRVLSQALLNQVKRQSQPNMYPPSRSHLPPTTGSVPITIAKKQSEECYHIHVAGPTSIANFR